MNNLKVQNNVGQVVTVLTIAASIGILSLEYTIGFLR
jgi:hypothetical protein